MIANYEPLNKARRGSQSECALWCFTIETARISEPYGNVRRLMGILHSPYMCLVCAILLENYDEDDGGGGEWKESLCVYGIWHI